VGEKPPPPKLMRPSYSRNKPLVSVPYTYCDSVNARRLQDRRACNRRLRAFQLPVVNMGVLEPKSRWGRLGLICVVEDDTDVAHLISHTLLSAGYSVSMFLSAANVIEEASLSIPSVFLLDIMLPGLSGFDLCRQIRQHERLQRTPIIFLSARSDETDCLDAFDAGADGYLTEPFSPRELVARIHNVVRIKDHLPNTDVLHVADIEMDIASMTRKHRESPLGKGGGLRHSSPASA